MNTLEKTTEFTEITEIIIRKRACQNTKTLLKCRVILNAVKDLYT